MSQNPRDYPINAQALAEWEAGHGADCAVTGCEYEVDWCWEKIAQLTTTTQIQREHIAQLKMFREGSRL